jgi:hypothetical protein
MLEKDMLILDNHPPVIRDVFVRHFPCREAPADTVAAYWDGRPTGAFVAVHMDAGARTTEVRLTPEDASRLAWDLLRCAAAASASDYRHERHTLDA